MEPRQSGQGSSFEHTPAPSQVGESYRIPEIDPQGSTERAAEFANEHPARPEVEGAAPILTALPAPLPQVDDSTGGSSASPVSTDAPDVAADEDLIEKEWVDKAKRIIESTKDDPYRRELEIGELQREYIRKRYGREIGEPGGQ